MRYVVLSKKISIKVKKIEVVKNWPKPKSVHNIQVFLGFTNFYWQFIQDFNRIAAPLSSILKTTESSDKPAPRRNNGSKSTSSKNNKSRPTSKKNNGNSKVDKFGGGGVEHARQSEKLKKLAKSRNLKGKKLFKSQKPTKSRKKSS